MEAVEQDIMSSKADVNAMSKCCVLVEPTRSGCRFIVTVALRSGASSDALGAPLDDQVSMSSTGGPLVDVSSSLQVVYLPDGLEASRARQVILPTDH